MNREQFDFILGIILYIIVCFGVVGNIISFFIWTKGRRCKNSSGGIYLRALDFSDTLVLLICATDKATHLLGATRLSYTNTFFCKLQKTSWHFGMLVSTWIVVSFTVERTIIMCRPQMSAKRPHQGRTVFLIVAIYITSFLLNIPWTLGHDIYFDIKNNTGILQVNITGIDHQNSSETVHRFCGMSASSFIYKHGEIFHFWFVDFFLIFSLPFTIVIACNTLVLCIVMFRRKRSRIKAGPIIHSVTARAIAISLVHCISTGPFSIAILVPGFYENAYITKTGPQYYIGNITVVCSYLNNGVNFILYSFFGMDFRRDCIEMFRRKLSVVTADTSIIAGSHQPKTHCEQSFLVADNLSKSRTLPSDTRETDA